jgi:hypothetical protein
MERLSRIRNDRFSSVCVLVLFSLLLSLPSYAKSPGDPVKSLEEAASEAIRKGVPCKRVEAQITLADGKTDALKGLAVKFDGIVLGEMTADHMSLVYENPVVDLARLKRSKELTLSSYSKGKAGILISPEAIERYFKNKAAQIKKSYNKISIKLAPPYIECFFDVPASEISPETLKLFDKFVKGSKLEGYAAFQIRAKNNELHALCSKVIVNHFLVPELILKELQTKFNPFDVIPVVKPFQYTINAVTVQNKYIQMTN